MIPTSRTGRDVVLDDAALAGMFAIGLFVSPFLGGVQAGRAASASLLIAALSVVYGRGLTRVLPVELNAPPLAAFVVIAGFAGVSLVHLTVTAVFNIGVAGATLADLAGAVAIVGLTMRGAGGIRFGRAGQGRWTDGAVIVACACLTSFWARETVLAVPQARQTGVFPAWQDYLLHASEISYLRDYPSYGGRSQYMTAIAQPLYHRASYAMSGLFSAVADASSLQTATAFWLPTGLLLCMIGIYAFGAALGGRRLAGVAAVAAVFLVPDASTYGFHNRFLSVHWLLQMAAGSGYAVALTLVALAAIVSARPGRQAASLAAAGILVAASGAFRVHVALLAGGMIAILAATSGTLRFSTRSLLVAVTAVVAAAAGLVALESVQLAPHFLTRHGQPVVFLQSVHSQAAGLPSPFAAWTAGSSSLWALMVGYPMLLVAGLGLFLLLWCAAWWGGALAAMGWRASAIPVALLAAHAGVILLVPTPAHGDPTDWGHRPFVLIYIVFATLTGAAVVRWLTTWSRRQFQSERAALMVLAAACGLGVAVPWLWGGGIQQRWSPQYSMIPVSADSFAAGDFIRERSAPGETALASGGDPLAIFVALSERRAFLSRAGLYRSLGPETLAVSDARADVQERCAAVATFDALRQLGQAEGIQWYIADTARTAGWPEIVKSRCSYCGETVQVYDLR